jgi:hypothetical protein
VEHLRIQSVLFQSPYSGCPGFSGWERTPCIAPIPWVPASRNGNAPGSILSVDTYRAGWRDRHPIGIALRGCELQRRPCPVIRRTSFKVCQGPSTAGPLTVRVPGFTPAFGVSNSGSGRLG